MAEREDILEIGNCECGCGCNDVSLHSDHQPEVLLFDEYGEMYQGVILDIDETTKGNAHKLDDIYESLIGGGSTGGLREFIHNEVTEAKDEIISKLPPGIASEATEEEMNEIEL